MDDRGVPQGQEPTQEEYVAQSQRRIALMQEDIRELAEANKALVEGVGDHEYTFTGFVGVTDIFFYHIVVAQVEVNDGTHLHFKGKSWGVGLGGLGSYGGGTFGYIPPGEIIGDCHFEVHNLGFGPASLQITWMRGSQLLGTFVGGGAGAGGAVSLGSGTWNLVT